MPAKHALRTAVRAGYKRLMGDNSSPWDLPVSLAAKVYGKRFTMRTRDGFRFSIDLEDLRGAAEYVRFGRTEPALCLLYTRFLRSGDRVLDIGANMGYFTVLAGSLVGDAGRVLSLEPTPNTASFCRANIGLNALEHRVAFHQCAASDAPGEATLYINPKYSGNNSLSDLGNRAPGDAANTVTVELRTVDELVADWPRVDLVKIDVEGHELRTLHGMRAAIERNARIVVVCEIAPRWLRAAKTDPIDLVNAFNELGLHGYRLDASGGLGTIDIANYVARLEAKDSGANVVFVRPEALAELRSEKRLVLV